MVQVPPRGVWGRSGRSLQAPLESWLGQAVSPMPVDRLVTRYLTAFGPATIRDTQTWCGLTKLAEIVEAIRPELVTFTDEDGRELFDVPQGPRPDGDTPAPVRFLYDYDNLLLSHADRSRVVLDVDYAAHGYTADSNRQPSSLLVDGFVAGTWTVTRQKGGRNSGHQGIRPAHRGAAGGDLGRGRGSARVPPSGSRPRGALLSPAGWRGSRMAGRKHRVREPVARGTTRARRG